MAKLFTVTLFCLFVTSCLQEDLQNSRRNIMVRNSPTPNEEANRGKDLNNVKPHEIIGTFGTYLKVFSTEAIGVDYIQNRITSWVKEGNNQAGSLLIKEGAELLSKRLTEKIDAVKRISDAAGRALSSKKKTAEAYHRCCDLPPKYKLFYDYRFKSEVSSELFCQMKAPKHKMEKEGDLSSVRTAFDTNKDKVKWQYFGSREGISTIFPAQRTSKCNSYDNRLRPWYVNTATPSPKNIIIMLDSSSSMGRDNSLETAKEIAKIVIGTLNPQDKVSVMLFNATTTLLSDQDTGNCYNSTLATAGTINIKYLKSFVDKAKPKGGTRFSRAFKKVFEILRNTLESSTEGVLERPTVVLLFTDGAPRTSDIEATVLKTVKSEIENLKQEYKGINFKLLAMALGTDSEGQRFIKRLTRATNGITMSAQRKRDPYSQLQSYFDYLMDVTPARGNDVIFTPPYVDAWGLGFMITAARAYFDDKQRFRGVAGVDIPMTDLLSDVQYLKLAGPKSYAFLVQTRTGHVMSHPLLPTPESITEDPNYVNILQLEPGERFARLFDKVQKAALRNSRMVHQRVLKSRARSVSRGGSPGDGVQSELVDYSYSCIPLNVGETIKEFIMCIALEQGETDALFKSLYIAVEASALPITYHRMDILPEAKTCYYTDTVSYADRSVVKFSAKAFGDPSKYLELDERKDAVKEYVESLRRILYRFQKTDVFAKDTVITTQLTSLLDNYWLSVENQHNYLKKIARRFIGTYNGVLRMLPGAPLPAGFDHVLRPWFARSVANKGKLTFTSPYVDVLGAGHVVSISHTLESRYTNKNVFGVVGADVSVSHLGAVLSKHLGKSCFDSVTLRCFLVDSNGYVVYHPSFENVYNDSSKVVGKHLTEVDATIARNLINASVMVRLKCHNFNIRKLQRYYEIVMKQSLYRGTSNTLRDCKSFIMVKVPDTNVLLIVTEASSCLSSPPKCHCDSTCYSQEDTACECPCTTRLEYNNCDDILTGNSTTPVCTQPSPAVNARPPLPKHPDDLGKCIRTHCSDYETRNDCNEIFGCVWCDKRDDGSLLEKPRCRSDRKCFGGMLGRSNPFLIPYKGQRAEERKRSLFLGLPITRTVLIVGGGALALLLLISVGIIVCLCRVKRKPKQEAMNFPIGMETFEQYENDFTNFGEQQLFDAANAFNTDQFFGVDHIGDSAYMVPMEGSDFPEEMIPNVSEAMQQGLAPSNMDYRSKVLSGVQPAVSGPSSVMYVPVHADALQTHSTVRMANLATLNNQSSAAAPSSSTVQDIPSHISTDVIPHENAESTLETMQEEAGSGDMSENDNDDS